MSSDRTNFDMGLWQYQLKNRWKRKTEALGLKPLHTVPLMLLRNLVIQHPVIMMICFQTRKEEASPMAETEETRNSCIAKREIYMATMNVQSIHPQNQREELARNFQDKGTCILGIVDHKIVHEDPVTFQQFDEATMIMSSA